MKKGGYQILELNCESNVNIIDDLKGGSVTLTQIISKNNSIDAEEFLNNLFKYNKTCLLKNLLINNQFITLFSNVLTNNDSIDIYLIDSNDPNGYSNYNPFETDYFIIKLNDDYVLLITLIGTAFIAKLYKGAITQ